MYNQIDWSKIKDNEQFREMCNLLLHEEISWDVKTYSARGKDFGIDAEFKGPYKGKNGYWIFQYKWHDLQRGLSAVRDSLRIQFKSSKKKPGEIDKVTGFNPNFYVILTNIPLLPQHYEKLEKSFSAYGFKIYIWDQSELNKKIQLNPSVYRVFFEGKPPLFEHYSERFRSELQDKEYLLNFTNPFIGRQAEIKTFHRIMRDEKEKLAVFYGTGGIGKTRLFITFAQLIEEQYRDWIPRFVRKSDEPFEEYLQQLLRQKKYVLLFDDAQDFLPFLDKIDYLLRSFKVKVLLNTRKSSKDMVLNAFPRKAESFSITEREVPSFTPQETRALITDEIVRRSEDLIDSLTSTCKNWPPLFILMAVRYLNKNPNRALTGLTEDRVLHRTFDAYLGELKSKCGDNAVKFLSLLSVLEPLDLNNENLVNKILEFLGLNIEAFCSISDELKNKAFVVSRDSLIKISPDILGDYLLRQYCFDSKGNKTNYIDSVIKQFIELAPEQILANLAQAEYGRTSLLDDVINDLSRELLSAGNARRFSGLKLTDKFAYYRPQDALAIIELIMKNPMIEDILQHIFWGKFSITHEIVLGRIPPVLQKIAYNINHFPQAIELLKDLALFPSESVSREAKEKLTNATELQYRKSIAYQEKALERFELWLKEGNQKLSQLCFDLLAKFFVTSIDYPRLDPVDPRKFVWSTYPIRVCFRLETLKRLRKKSFELLFANIEKGDRDLKIKGFAIITDAIHNLLFQNTMGRNVESKYLYPSKNELSKILDFVEHFSVKEMDYSVLDAIKGALNTFRRKKLYAERIKRIKKAIENKNEYVLYEELIGQHKDWLKAFEDKRDYLQKPRIKRIISTFDNNPRGFAELLSSFIDLQPGWIFGSVKKFMYEIGLYKGNYALKMFDVIVNERPSIIFYAGYILAGLRGKKPRPVLERIESLRNQDVDLKMAILDSFDPYFNTKQDIEDLDWIEKIALAREPKLNNRIAEILAPRSESSYFQIDKKKVLSILGTVSECADYPTAGAIAAALTSERVEVEEADMDLFEKILWNFVELKKLDKEQMASYYIELFLKRLFDARPLKVIEFFEERIELRDTLKKEDSDFDAVPHRLGSVFADFDRHSTNTRLAICRRVRDWAKKSNWFRIEAPRFFKLLCSKDNASALHTNINEDAKTVLMEWVQNKDAEPKRHEEIVLAGYLLRDFEDSDLFYEIIQELFNKADEYTSDERRKITSEISAAIHTGTFSGDSKQRAIIKYLTRIRNKVGPVSQKEIDQEIQRQNVKLSRFEEEFEDF